MWCSADQNGRKRVTSWVTIRSGCLDDGGGKKNVVSVVGGEEERRRVRKGMRDRLTCNNVCNDRSCLGCDLHSHLGGMRR